ncbi:hypothetical protein QQP08_011437 [Theobroma cacao]|nr:hypothetical protein QQP08_011437 [Theobroma cacao]
MLASGLLHGLVGSFPNPLRDLVRGGGVYLVLRLPVAAVGSSPEGYESEIGKEKKGIRRMRQSLRPPQVAAEQIE